METTITKKLSSNLLDYILITFFTFNELIEVSKTKQNILKLIKNNYLFVKYTEFISLNITTKSLKSTMNLKLIFTEIKNYFNSENTKKVIFNLLNFVLLHNHDLDKIDFADFYEIIPLEILLNFVDSKYNTHPILIFTERIIKVDFISIRLIICFKNEFILVALNNYTIKIYNKNDYKIYKILIGHSGNIISLLELENGLLASCSSDKTIRIYDSQDEFNCIKILNGHEWSI